MERAFMSFEKLIVLRMLERNWTKLHSVHL